MSSRSGFVVTLAIAAVVALMAWPAQPMARATNLGLTVTGFDDDEAATCPKPLTTCDSLRAAVKQANSDGSGEHLINLAAGTYNLTLKGDDPDDDAGAGDLDILEDITIQGAGANQTFIDAKKIKERAFHILAGGSLTLRDLTVQRGNARRPADELTGAGSGGGVLSFGAFTAERVVFTRNKSFGDGGGISGETGTMNLNEVTIARNKSRDDGAGLDFDDGTLVVDRATFVRNKAKGEGGGMENEATDSSLTNVTFSRNKSRAGGGGINNEDGGQITLTHATIAFNKSKLGGGVLNDTSSGPSTVTIRNTIIAKNKKTDCAGDINGEGGNIQGDGTCGGSTEGDPLLAPLDDYGGDSDFTTLTHALQAGSPAIDAGDTDACNDTSTDQRGFARFDDPSVKAGLCDSGSFEFGSKGPPVRPNRSRR